MVNKIVLLVFFVYISTVSLAHADTVDIPIFRSSYDANVLMNNDVLENYNGIKVGLDSLRDTFTPSIMLLTTFTPEDYHDKLSPSDSNDPYKRYSSTYFGDDTEVSLGLAVSNFLLGSAVKKVLGDNFLFSLNSDDGFGVDFAVKPVYWVNLKLGLSGLDTEYINSELRVEMAFIENLVFFVKYSDSIIERKPSLEMRYYF